MRSYEFTFMIINIEMVERKKGRNISKSLIKFYAYKIRTCNCKMERLYTKTGLVFGFSKNQILVAVILWQNSFWILSENYFEMSIYPDKLQTCARFNLTYSPGISYIALATDMEQVIFYS